MHIMCNINLDFVAGYALYVIFDKRILCVKCFDDIVRYYIFFSDDV